MNIIVGKRKYLINKNIEDCLSYKKKTKINIYIFIGKMPRIKKIIQTYLRRILIQKIQLNQNKKIITNFHKSCLETVATPETKNIPIYPYILKQYTTPELFSVPDIYSANLYNCIYYTKYNSVFTHDRKLIVDSVMNHIKPEKYSIRNLYLYKPEKIPGVCTIFRSIFSENNYYHTVIDHISRIYLIDQSIYKEIDEIKLLVPNKLTKIEKYFFERISPKNISVKIINSNNIYCLENLIFPSFLSRQNSGYLPSTYLKYFWSKILPKRSRNKINRIYISRKLTTSGGMRCVLNESELIDQLKNYGFQKYSLENMPIEDQIELFYDAEIVIAPHGAGLTNLIFSEKIHVLELFSGTGVLPHFYYLSKSLGHNYKYLCGKANDKNANFEADIDQVLKIVSNFA